MRIVRYLDASGQTHFGEQNPVGSVTRLAGSTLDALTPTGERAEPARLLAPLAPANIFCIGLNYREHAAESSSDIPEHPVVFMKPTSAVQDPGEPIVIPAATRAEGEVDYECELAAVIARPARNVLPEQALEHVFGYTCANDVSARRWQRHNGGQWIRGKSFDTFCPIGPCIVTADEIGDPQTLAISTRLNGRTMQSHTTGDMIFTVAQIVSFLSRDTTLLPGTVILTGTPQGVGFARQPPVWLKAGDVVEIEVEKIGVLRNPVVAA